jgi:hypothetical protein
VANTGLLIAVPLIPAAGIAAFIISTLRKGQIDMTLLWGLRTRLSCYRTRTLGNFWLFIGAAGFVTTGFIGLAGLLAWLGNSN